MLTTDCSRKGMAQMTHTLVIDTSYGSTVGIVGCEPITEPDSRTHVEHLQQNIARAVRQAGLTPADITHIVAGTGPAPFTGLRAGIVTAKALAYVTGAALTGRDILAPQAQWNLLRHQRADTLGQPARVLTLAVNDARRKQLYYALYDAQAPLSAPLVDMDIDYPAAIVQRVNATVQAWCAAQACEVKDVVVDVLGHGVARYADVLQNITQLGICTDESVLDQGAEGLALFASGGDGQAAAGSEPVEPLYLRRPDAQIPNPLKHVLGHAGATRA